MSWQPRLGAAEASAKEVRIAAADLLVAGQVLSSAVQTPEIGEETRTSEEFDLPWQVVVHNDPVNLMTYVTMVFQKVFGYDRKRAEQHMLEVHHKGRSILWSGMRERAELYVQQLHGYLLLATIERVM